MAVVCVALVVNGLLEVWGSYREHKDALIRIDRRRLEQPRRQIGHKIGQLQRDHPFGCGRGRLLSGALRRDGKAIFA